MRQVGESAKIHPRALWSWVEQVVDGTTALRIDAVELETGRERKYLGQLLNWDRQLVGADDTPGVTALEVAASGPGLDEHLSLAFAQLGVYVCWRNEREHNPGLPQTLGVFF